MTLKFTGGLDFEAVETHWDILGHHGGRAAMFKAPEDTVIHDDDGELVKVRYDEGSYAVLDHETEELVQTFNEATDAGHVWGFIEGYDMAVEPDEDDGPSTVTFELPLSGSTASWSTPKKPTVDALMTALDHAKAYHDHDPADNYVDLYGDIEDELHRQINDQL